MKHIKFFIGIALLISIFACKEKEPDKISPGLQGGKGGDYSMVVFTKYNGVGKSSRIYLKYAANDHPGDTTLFEERTNTMIEPGFGPHAHFNSLTQGTYYVWCSKGVIPIDYYFKDTVIVIDNASPKSQDIYVNLKKL